MDVYIEAFGADSTIGKQYADMKKTQRMLTMQLRKLKITKIKL